MRTCHSVGEFRQVFQLQKEIWNFSDADLVPVRMFVVGEKIGGHSIAAWEGNNLVGFTFALPGIRNQHPYLHSHMLGVKESHRNSGLGRALKLFQREIASGQGFRLIEWTFDPLEIKNAFLNLEKLGAVVRRYSVNHYGITSSPLQGGLPSDRLVAEWWIDSDRVRCVLSGERCALEVLQRVEVPAEIYAWKANEETRSQAARVQAANRDKLMKALSSGLSIIGYERDEQGNGTFLLGYWSEEANFPRQGEQ